VSLIVQINFRKIRLLLLKFYTLNF